MNMWTNPVRSSGRIQPVIRIQPYARLNSRTNNQARQEATIVDPPLKTILYREQKATQLIDLSPLELAGDDKPFLSYSAYNEDKQKTWRIPHQGLIMNTYA